MCLNDNNFRNDGIVSIIIIHKRRWSKVHKKLIQWHEYGDEIRTLMPPHGCKHGIKYLLVRQNMENTDGKTHSGPYSRACGFSIRDIL